ncbi:MAG: von Willebrand factor type A domain-containing protein [Planctomycetes bacterium]|nr:von Willebrand factor type A domain-containing protein [Planctomycetota bacterium]
MAQLGYLTDHADDGRSTQSRSATGESYAPVHENDFRVLSADDPAGALSTFGIDVDTASYANVRRFLTRNEAPPPDAVRLEELINYFPYDDPRPRRDGEDGGRPFAVSVGVASAPWRPENRLVRIALAAEDDATEGRPASNLVFLLDVSGSMEDADKLPLLKASLELLLRELDERDRVAIVTYADGSRVALPSTPCSDKTKILGAIESLTAQGSTHASAGIEEAYRVASENLREGGNNRVILATDGDFNVGITDSGDLQRFIEAKAKSGVFLTVLGFGTGNLKDSIAELLADKGNGNYAYIDTLNEAHKVLVEEMGGTLRTVAKDVKIQVEFNPGRVRAYRLLGYENRALAARDFRDDQKDAGELGAGHSIVALYEVVPVGAPLPDGVELRYRQVAADDASTLVESPDLLTVALRYKLPEGDTAREFEQPVIDEGVAFEQASDDFRFSAAVASFGMILRHSAYRGETDLQRVLDWAEAAKGRDAGGYRAEFVRLVRTAQGIAALR